MIDAIKYGVLIWDYQILIFSTFSDDILEGHDRDTY